MRPGSSRLLFLAILLAACGEPVPTIPTDAGRRDAQPIERDSGPPVDAAPVDAQTSDGGELDGGGTTFDPGRCRADASSDVLTLATDSLARVRNVGVAAGDTLLGVAWSYRSEGAENVWLAEIPATGTALITGQQITTGTSLQRDPVLVANGAGWILAWYGNPDGDFDAYAQGWQDGRVVPGGSRERLTMRTGRDDAPALLALPTGAMAGWVETRGDTMMERVPVLRPLSATAAPTAAQREGATSTAVPSFVLAQRTGGLSLAWVESGSAAPDAMLQRLDASGAPTGAAIALSTEHNADGSIDLAADAGGGAVVFGTTIGGLRPEVRARLLDGSGMPMDGTSERVITVAPSSGRDATIARIAGGYVIAYRALGAAPTVRLDLRDAALAPVGTLDVADASPSGGRVTVRVSGEGRMIVGWADVDTSAGTTAIRAARVRCD